MLPQIIVLILLGMGLGMDLISHGKPRDTQYNIWASLIATTITLGLLYWGGFFAPPFK